MVEAASKAWRRLPGLEIHVKSDAELVAEVLRGEMGSFEVLVQRYQRAVMGTALAVLGDFHAAQDAAQDAFIVAYRKLGTLRSGASFAPWILRLARRQAVELSRQQAKRRQVTIPPDLANVSSDGQLDDAARVVFAAVDCLPRRQREAVLHRYCDGLSVQETAHAMGIAVGTATKCLSRAYARLRQILSEEPGQ
jgi:RNA polymerase sigma-70 factor (ECF subfamily)